MLFKRLQTIAVIVVLAACSPEPSLNSLDENAVILAYGDSLTYGTGAPRDDSYPSELARLTGLNVINAGIPGEISQLGLERLPDVLAKTQADLVILMHGGNDLIRKIGKTQLKNNLDQMIIQIQNSGAQVVLIAVPSFNFTLSAPELYSQLAETHNIPIQLDIMSELERSPKLKSDQIHMNAAGNKILAESIYMLLQSTNALVK